MIKNLDKYKKPFIFLMLTLGTGFSYLSGKKLFCFPTWFLFFIFLIALIAEIVTLYKNTK